MIIKHFKHCLTERVTKSGHVTYDDLTIIPQTSEKYMMFEIGKLRFLDSYQFLSASLEKLVDTLDKSKFTHTAKHFLPTPLEKETDATDRFDTSTLVFGKGVYPYGYMTSRARFAETELPPIKEFFNTLTGEELDPADYERAKKTWQYFKIQNMQQYHDHYLLFYYWSMCLKISDTHFTMITNWTACITSPSPPSPGLLLSNSLVIKLT